MSLSSITPGLRIGKYEVVAHVASGGMGAIYKALDVELRRIVALKVLPAKLAQNERVLERFRREARHAARLSHPNIVTLFECGHNTDLDIHYLALEFVDGIDLARFIQQRGRLRPEEARRILIQAAKALEHAFAHGVIHRDIKPSNFLLAKVEKKTVVKLTDLGLARVEDDDDFKVTREGSTVGTIDYMAPEQARDSRGADIRSDIYSLGCTAYHMLAGKPPFAEGGLGERVFKHMEMAPPDVRTFNPAVSGQFWAVVQKMLAKSQADRYQAPAELLTWLKRTVAETLSDQEEPTVFDVPGERHTVCEPSPAAAGAKETPAPPPAQAPQQRPKEPAPAAPPLTTLEQARTAQASYERAVQVLAAGGADDHARQMLVNCLKLEPANTDYRQTLRQVHQRSSAGALGRLMGSLNGLATKSRMRLARTSGDWRKVLECGEEVLARQAADAETHLALAEAAQKLDLPHLEKWLLEQGREQAPDSVDLMRALARLHENLREWKLAIALWERVRALDSSDFEAARKINDLSATEHLAGGIHRR